MQFFIDVRKLFSCSNFITGVPGSASTKTFRIVLADWALTQWKSRPPVNPSFHAAFQFNISPVLMSRLCLFLCMISVGGAVSSWEHSGLRASGVAPISPQIYNL